MTYCTPKAVQEQILKRKLAASGCAVSWNTDRPDAVTRRPALPDDLQLHLLGYVRDASTVLALEIASKAVLSLRRSQSRHKEHEQMWVGFLRARFPREAPALLSLGDHERRLGLRPRAPARQLYKAFCTKKVAEPDIQTVALERGEESHDELAFIAVVGGFAGVASWTEENADGEKADLLRWQPPSTEAHLGVFENLDDGVTGEATVEELTGERLHQELHVIDLRTFLCVTLLSLSPDEGLNIVDGWEAVPELQDDDAVFFTSPQEYMTRDHASNPYPRGHYIVERYTAGCSLLPFLALRPEVGRSDNPFHYRVLFADFVIEPRPSLDWFDLYYDDRTRFINRAEDFCELVAQIIRQTHSPLHRYAVAA